MTAPVPAAGIVEAAAKALASGEDWMRNLPGYSISEAVLAAALPLIADQIDKIDFGDAPLGVHPGSFVAGSVMAKLCAVGLLRSLAEGLGDEH